MTSIYNIDIIVLFFRVFFFASEEGGVMSAAVDSREYRLILVRALAEVRRAIKKDGLCPKDLAWLYHEQGSLYGQLGLLDKQKKSWEKAIGLDPKNDMIISSLKSLSR